MTMYKVVFSLLFFKMSAHDVVNSTAVSEPANYIRMYQGTKYQILNYARIHQLDNLYTTERLVISGFQVGGNMDDNDDTDDEDM
jgi:hypothetical protein